MEINKNTNIGELIATHPKLIELFFEFGLPCAGCPASAMDTIEEGAKIHGFSDTKIEELINKIKELLHT